MYKLFPILLLTASMAFGQVVDHNNLASFDSLSPEQLAATRQLRILFMDRSVGWNTHEALGCLTASTYGESGNTCRRDYQYQADGSIAQVLYFQADHDSGLVPPTIDFNPGPQYDRSNMVFHYFHDTWDKMAVAFAQGIHNGVIQTNDGPISIADFDAISFQFSYLNVMDGDTINNWFTHLPGEFDDAYDLERELSEHIDPLGKVFVYWTSSLARAIGTEVATDFNNRMRTWAAEHHRPLFDFADIESHETVSGLPCLDVQYGLWPAICEDKTSERYGGHFSSAQAEVTIAKAFWLLHSQLTDVEPPPPPPDPVDVLKDWLDLWFQSHSIPITWDNYELAGDLLEQ